MYSALSQSHERPSSQQVYGLGTKKSYRGQDSGLKGHFQRLMVSTAVVMAIAAMILAVAAH